MMLTTDRLLIREFKPDDLAAIHRILNEAFGDGQEVAEENSLRRRESWLRWSMLSQEWLPRMHQPPYGDRAVVLRAQGALIGAVGYVPLLAPFGQIPELEMPSVPGGLYTPEVGLFWVIRSDYRRHGLATEAARALIEHGFKELRLKRILATTEHDNLASQGVMRRLGMQITRNPLPEPEWFQVVGVLRNPS